MAQTEGMNLAHEKACHICSCLIYDGAITPNVCPVLIYEGKCLCASSACSAGTECGGEKGCCLSVGKHFCCVHVCDPNHIAIGLCNHYCFGERPNIDDPEAHFMENVFWCKHVCCSAWGCANPCVPCTFLESRCCCVEAKTVQGADVCSHGCCASRNKICCLMTQAEFPPQGRIGIGCCGVQLLAPSMPFETTLTVKSGGAEVKVHLGAKAREPGRTAMVVPLLAEPELSNLSTAPEQEVM